MHLFKSKFWYESKPCETLITTTTNTAHSEVLEETCEKLLLHSRTCDI